MHTIEVMKKLNTTEEKLYVAAIIKAMDINLPSKVTIRSINRMSTYTVTGFCISEIYNEPGECFSPGQR